MHLKLVPRTIILSFAGDTIQTAWSSMELRVQPGVSSSQPPAGSHLPVGRCFHAKGFTEHHVVELNWYLQVNHRGLDDQPGVFGLKGLDLVVDIEKRGNVK